MKETDLIKLLEQELELAKQMPGTTRDEIAARNDKINAINKEIQALKDLTQERLAMRKLRNLILKFQDLKKQQQI